MTDNSLITQDPACLFPPISPPMLSVEGEGARMPVRRIFCVGRNYADHAAEVGAGRDEPPVFFTKPMDAVIGADAAIPYPPHTADFQPEVELVVAIGQGGVDITPAEAMSHVLGFAVGNDLTRRDRQTEARQRGGPWDLAKAFDRSAQVGVLQRREFSRIADARIWLTVDGEPRQSSRLRLMIWSVPEIIATLSRSVELKPGDLIFTGTPGGVGPIHPGNTVVAGIDGLGEISLRVEP